VMKSHCGHERWVQAVDEARIRALGGGGIKGEGVRGGQDQGN
jgi:hypothetical protein